jgi:small subunit ribosomal protein S4
LNIDKDMARNTGPKSKLSRRAGQDLGLKSNPAKAAKRLNIPPGQHGRKGGKKLSGYGIQLREKQKCKWIYGIQEKQFRRYVELATKNPSATGEELLRILECRLDNAVYRLGMAPTRAAARQLVVHGNVKVDDRKVDRPSYQVAVGNLISLTPTAQKIPYIASLLEEKAKFMPKWLSRQASVGKVNAMPDRSDIEGDINENMIVEYYSR